MKNQRLPVQFKAPDDGWCVARNVLSLTLMWNNKFMIHCCISLDFSLGIVLWCTDPRTLTLILLKWRIWWAHNNVSKWQTGFNLAFKGLSNVRVIILHILYVCILCFSNYLG
jgi:hypothetical protein